MSPNMKVVKFFISEFHKNNAVEISYIAAPEFVFTLNSGEKQSFEDYAKRMQFLNHRSHLHIGEPLSKNDQNFYSEFEIQVPNEQGELEYAYGKAEFIVEKILLRALNITYYKSKEEYDEFVQMMKNSSIAFV